MKKKTKKKNEQGLGSNKKVVGTDDYTFGPDWIPTSLGQRKKMKRLHKKINRSLRTTEDIPSPKNKTFSRILKDQLEKGKEYFLITSCSPSNEEEVKKQLLRYTKLLSQNLGLSYYDQHFVGQESSSVSKVEKIIPPNSYVILHPIFFFDGFLSKKNVLFFEKIFKKNILILKPLVFYKKVKDAIEIKLLRNFEVFE